MSTNKDANTSQNVQPSSPSLTGGQILPPAQIRPIEESNMMNFHNTVKKTTTFIIGGNLTENRQNTQMINQNINRIVPNKAHYNSEPISPKASNSPSAPFPTSNPQPTPKQSVPPPNPQLSKNSPVTQPTQQPQNTPSPSIPTQKQQPVQRVSTPPPQANVKLANATLPVPAQPKPLQSSPVVQRSQNQPSHPTTNLPPNTNNNTVNLLQHQSVQRQTPQQQQNQQPQTQHAPSKPIVAQPHMNNSMQQQNQQALLQQQMQQQLQQTQMQQLQQAQMQQQKLNPQSQMGIAHTSQPKPKVPVQRPTVPQQQQQQQQQQQTYFQQPAPKVATAPPNPLKRPHAQKDLYESLYRERQALYQLQMHTLSQRQHWNYLKQQPDQTVEEISKQIQEIERQYLQQQQKLAELDARLVQQMKQEPVRNSNLAMQHTRLQAAIEDIRKEPPRVAPPKPRGRPVMPFPSSSSSGPASSAPLPKKVKKVSSDGEDSEPKIKPTRFNYFGNTPNYELSWLMLGSQTVKDILTQHKSPVPNVSAEFIYNTAQDAERQKKAKKLKTAQMNAPSSSNIKLGNNNAMMVPQVVPQPVKSTPPPVGTIFIDEKTA